MPQYIIFLLLDKLEDLDVYTNVVESIVQHEVSEGLVNCLSTLQAACIQPYSSIQSNEGDQMKAQSWALIKNKDGGDGFVNNIKSQTIFSESMIPSLADSLHILADQLPPLGAVTDVIWIVRDATNFNCDLSIYGALKRLCQWHNAMVRIFDSSGHTGNVSPELMLWSQSLQVHFVPAGVRNRLSLWHGSIAIAGSQQTVKLPGFHLTQTSSGLFNANSETCFGIRIAKEFAGELGLFFSTTMKFVAEVNLREVPVFYLTRHCYQLSILSESDAVECSRQFLNRLTTIQDMCYIVRLCYGTSHRRVKSVADQSQRAKSWQEMIKENIANASDNPCSSELSGRLGCVNFIIRPMKLEQKCDNAKLDGKSNPSVEFVAIRMRDVTEFDGAVAHALAQTVSNEKNLMEKVNKIRGTCRSRLLRGVRRLSGKELFGCLKSSSLNNYGNSVDIESELSNNDQSAGIIHRPQPECMRDLFMQPERQMLSFNTTAHMIEDGSQLARDTFGKLSPPSKQKVIILTASEIVKFFNNDGTAVIESKLPVVMKKPYLRIFRYNNVDDDGELRWAGWPKCLDSHFHDVYYNVGNAETIEKQCNRLRFLLSGSETASTCSTHEQNVPLIKSQQYVVRSDSTNSSRPIQRHTAHKEDETCRHDIKRHASLKYDTADTNTRISSNGRTQKNTMQVIEGECRKRKRNAEQEIPRSRLQQQPAKKLHTSQSASQVPEPRSLRNRRKMEEVIRETLMANEVDVNSSLFEPCFKRLCTITETFVRDLPTSRGLREEMQKIAKQYAAHTIDFEKNCQQQLITAGIKR